MFLLEKSSFAENLASNLHIISYTYMYIYIYIYTVEVYSSTCGSLTNFPYFCRYAARRGSLLERALVALWCQEIAVNRYVTYENQTISGETPRVPSLALCPR